MNSEDYKIEQALTVTLEGDRELSGHVVHLPNGRSTWAVYATRHLFTEEHPTTDDSWLSSDAAYMNMRMVFETWAKRVAKPRKIGECAYDDVPIMSNESYDFDTQQRMRCARHPEWADDLNAIRTRLAVVNETLADVEGRLEIARSHAVALQGEQQAEHSRLKGAGYDLTKLYQ